MLENDRGKEAIVRLITSYSISRAVLICSNKATKEEKLLPLGSDIIKLIVFHCHFLGLTAAVAKPKNKTGVS